jgi:hypothetical protein
MARAIQRQPKFPHQREKFPRTSGRVVAAEFLKKMRKAAFVLAGGGRQRPAARQVQEILMPVSEAMTEDVQAVPPIPKAAIQTVGDHAVVYVADPRTPGLVTMLAWKKSKIP